MTASIASNRTCTEVLRTRRSWLGWTGEPLSRELVDEILTDAATAPSECNLQPWRFVVAQDDAIERVAPAFLESNQGKLREAGTVIVLFGDPDIIDTDPKATAFYGLDYATRRDFVVRNVSLAAMALMAGAWSRGIGTRPMIGFDPAKLRELCQVAGAWEPVVAIAAGVPAEPRHGVSSRTGVEEISSWL